MDLPDGGGHAEKACGVQRDRRSIGEEKPGGFAGYASGNEFALRDGFQHCCLGNSTRALYYLWENIVESKGDEFRVNLLLNRASAWADVYSFIPYAGRVT